MKIFEVLLLLFFIENGYCGSVGKNIFRLGKELKPVVYDLKLTMNGIKEVIDGQVGIEMCDGKLYRSARDVRSQMNTI